MDNKRTIPQAIKTERHEISSDPQSKPRFERRTSQSIRNAINVIQDSLFDPDTSDQVYQLLLNSLSELTSSDWGVCFTSIDNAEFPILPATSFKSIYYKDTPAFVNQKVLASWVGQKNVLTSSVYYNAPIPKGTHALLQENLPELCGLMILPVIFNKELRAICLLGNTQSEYSSSMLALIRPVLDALICSLSVAETITGNFIGLDPRLADERYLSSLISSSPVGIVVVDDAKIIVLSNPVSQELFDPSVDKPSTGELKTLAGTPITDFFPEFDSFFQWSNQHDKFNNQIDVSGPRIWKHQRALRKDGSICVVDVSIFRYKHDNERYTTLQIQDLTTYHQKTEEYKRTSQQLNALTQLAPVGILHITSEWHCIYSNEKWTEFSGLSHYESEQREWINAIHPNDVSELLLALRNSLNAGVNHNQEVRLLSPNGATKWIDFSMRVLFDDDNQTEGFLCTCHDITERYVNQEKLRYIAEFDGLTGLATRLLFQDRLQQAFYDSERDNSVISIFFLDLDGFKDINDTLGHDIGDRLLQMVSDRLVNILRKNDTVARFGGDEFVVMLGHNEHISEVITVANKVIDSIAKPYNINEHEVFITTSLGIAQGSHESASPEGLLKNADFALYSAKREGKNKFQLFNESLEATSKARITLLNDLRTGLQRNKFSLHYQAIFDSLSHEIVGFEALIRFTDKNDNLVGPDSFIHLLEESSMIVEVGAWVIDEVCRQHAHWAQDDVFCDDLYIAFNVSAKQLLNQDIVSHIHNSCEKHGVNPSSLVMEITESVFINKPNKVRQLLEQIKMCGIKLALDDFGTGFSSLSYLQNFPFDIIKIDKSFISHLTENSHDSKIVKAIIGLASSFELRVVAEGVESLSSQKAVELLGAHLIQGFLISKPLLAKNIPDFVMANAARKTNHKGVTK